MKINKHIKIILKLTFSVIIFFTLLKNLELDEVFNYLLNFDTTILMLCLFLVAISLLLMVLKWKIFTDKLNKKKVLALYMIYWASDFTSLFNLGSIGSETYKMLAFEDKKKALSFSLIDKAYAFLWYTILFLSVFFIFVVSNTLGIFQILMSFILYFILVLFYINIEKYIFEINYFKNKLKFLKFKKLLLNKELLIHSILALLFKINTFIIYSIILFASGIEFDYVLFAFLSLLTILTTLPISFQGLGVREFVLVFYANFMGFSPEGALAASFMIFILFLIFRIIGVIPFLIINKY